MGACSDTANETSISFDNRSIAGTTPTEANYLNVANVVAAKAKLGERGKEGIQSTEETG